MIVKVYRSILENISIFSGEFNGFHHHIFITNIFLTDLTYQGAYQWYLVARWSSNDNGCSEEGYLDGKSGGISLAECKDYCKDTKFLQFHENGHCSCFQSCDFKRPASDFSSKADVYEKGYLGTL